MEWLQRMGVGLAATECQRVTRASSVSGPSRRRLESQPSWQGQDSVESALSPTSSYLLEGCLETRVISALEHVRVRNNQENPDLYFEVYLYKYCVFKRLHQWSLRGGGGRWFWSLGNIWQSLGDIFAGYSWDVGAATGICWESRDAAKHAIREDHAAPDISSAAVEKGASHHCASRVGAHPTSAYQPWLQKQTTIPGRPQIPCQIFTEKPKPSMNSWV